MSWESGYGMNIDKKVHLKYILKEEKCVFSLTCGWSSQDPLRGTGVHFIERWQGAVEKAQTLGWDELAFKF